VPHDPEHRIAELESRLAEAEERIGRLVAFSDKVIDEYEQVHPAHVLPLTRTMRILHPGDLVPIAPAPAPEG